MTTDLDAQIIREFSRDIAMRLTEAVVIARTADGFGLAERAFQSLLELEPLMHDVSVLLNATAIVRRRDPRLAE